MKRILAIALVAALAAVPATKPASAGDRTIGVEVHALPQSIQLGQRGTWSASRYGDWAAGGLELYISGQIADIELQTLYPDTLCEPTHTPFFYHVACTVAPGPSGITVTATLVLSAPELKARVWGYDRADTYIWDDWQFVSGAHRLHLPALIR